MAKQLSNMQSVFHQSKLLKTYKPKPYEGGDVFQHLLHNTKEQKLKLLMGSQIFRLTSVFYEQSAAEVLTKLLMQSISPIESLMGLLELGTGPRNKTDPEARLFDIEISLLLNKKHHTDIARKLAEAGLQAKYKLSDAEFKLIFNHTIVSKLNNEFDASYTKKLIKAYKDAQSSATLYPIPNTRIVSNLDATVVLPTSLFDDIHTQLMRDGNAGANRDELIKTLRTHLPTRNAFNKLGNSIYGKRQPLTRQPQTCGMGACATFEALPCERDWLHPASTRGLNVSVENMEQTVKEIAAPLTPNSKVEFYTKLLQGALNEQTIGVAGSLFSMRDSQPFCVGMNCKQAGALEARARPFNSTLKARARLREAPAVPFNSTLKARAGEAWAYEAQTGARAGPFNISRQAPDGPVNRPHKAQAVETRKPNRVRVNDLANRNATPVNPYENYELVHTTYGSQGNIYTYRDGSGRYFYFHDTLGAVNEHGQKIDERSSQSSLNQPRENQEEGNKWQENQWQENQGQENQGQENPFLDKSQYLQTRKLIHTDGTITHEYINLLDGGVYVYFNYTHGVLNYTDFNRIGIAREYKT